MAPRTCYRHPDEKAITRCYYCKKPICKQCRLHLAHHYFCSRKCYYRFRIQEVWQVVRRHRWEVVVGWNVLMFLLIVIALVRSPSLSEPRVSSASARQTDSLLTAAAKDSLHAVWQPLQNAIVVHRQVVQRGVYRVSVPLKANWVATVWRNGVPVATRIARQEQEAVFTVPLMLGMNHIRVQVQDNQHTVLTEVFEIDYQNATVRALRRSVDQVVTHQPLVALTFDGGSVARGADSILAILRRHQVRVTMFITGQFIKKYPQLVQQMIADGHQVGNHTYNHPHLTTYARNGRHETLPHVTRQFLQQQLLHTDSLFHQLTGRHLAPLWRAPYGEINREILTWAAELGYLHVGWSPGLDTFDWVSDSTSSLYHTPEETLQRILTYRGKPRNLQGKIVLMHLGNHRVQPVYTMLPALLDSLQRRGLRVVTVEQLLRPES